MRIFEHNFVADKAKIRRRAAARQGLLTQYATKFAENPHTFLMKTGSNICAEKSPRDSVQRLVTYRNFA